MSIKKIYHKIKKENYKNAQFSLNPLVEYIFRYFGFYLSAVLVKLKIHPTSVNLTNLCLGVVATFLIYLSVDNLKIVLILFLLSIFIDLTDGNLARYYGISSFWGRFLDSTIDIIVGCLLLISLLIYCYYSFNDPTIMLTGVFALAAFTIYNLIYDKYSSLARWSNLINKTKVNPYIRLLYYKRINFTILDIEKLILFLLLIINIDELKYILIYLFFILNIIKCIFNLNLHLFLAKKYMYYSQNKNRNN